MNKQSNNRVTHTISGHNFHGQYSVTIQTGIEGELTSSQINRIVKTLCGKYGCQCGGGYGNGPDKESSKVDLIRGKVYEPGSKSYNNKKE